MSNESSQPIAPLRKLRAKWQFLAEMEVGNGVFLSQNAEATWKAFLRIKST